MHERTSRMKTLGVQTSVAVALRQHLGRRAPIDERSNLAALAQHLGQRGMDDALRQEAVTE